MKKIMKLSESDLTRIVKRIISEETMNTSQQFTLRPCKPGENGTLVKQGNVYALSKGVPFCQIM